jgi:hypothetical protein
LVEVVKSDAGFLGDTFIGPLTGQEMLPWAHDGAGIRRHSTALISSAKQSRAKMDGLIHHEKHREKFESIWLKPFP